MTKYLEKIDLLKKLQPILDGLGVEEDSYLIDTTKVTTGDSVANVVKQCVKAKVKTYRSDTLENVLPEVCYTGKGYFPDEQWILIEDIYHKAQDTFKKRGQPKLEALAELIILLHENGIELERGTGL